MAKGDGEGSKGILKQHIAWASSIGDLPLPSLMLVDRSLSPRVWGQKAALTMNQLSVITADENSKVTMKFPSQTPESDPGVQPCLAGDRSGTP